MQKLFTHAWTVLCVFIALSIVMRFFSFFPSVIDHDESTYMVIASALLDGSVYWRDVIDTKPIGIFLLFAFFQTLFGKSILVIRIMAALWVALSAWMLYLVHRQFIKPSALPLNNNTAPIASGIIYIFLTSIFTFYGVSPNTELFFCLFTITALYLILKDKHLVLIFIAGLLLGTGFIIKYVVLFDALAIGVFYLWLKNKEGRNWQYWFPRCVVMAIGFTIPFLLSWLYFWRMGMMEEFMYYSFELSGNYISQPPFQKIIAFIFDFLLRYFPVTFWFIYCSWNRRDFGNAIPLLAWMWGSLVIFIILLPGKLFGHYFIQFMLPLSLLAGSFFDSRRVLPKSLAWMTKPSIGYPILILAIIINIVFQKKDYFDKRDYPREIAAWMKTRLLPDELIYTGKYQQIIYLLTDTKAPTPYIHSSLIWSEGHNYALQIDQTVEWKKILQQKPRFILIEKESVSGQPFYDQVLLNYSLVHTFENEIRVYERF